MDGTLISTLLRDSGHFPSKPLSINRPTRVSRVTRCSLRLRTRTTTTTMIRILQITPQAIRMSRYTSNGRRTLKTLLSYGTFASGEILRSADSRKRSRRNRRILSERGTCPVKDWVGTEPHSNAPLSAELWILKVPRSFSEISSRNTTRSFPRPVIPSSTASETTQRACKVM